MKKILLLITFIFSFSLVFAQQRQIKGKIMDESESPIIGVAVLVKGTNKATSTDENGNFQITVPPDAKTIVCSYLSMKTKEVALQGSSNFTITMEKSDQSLQEVTVVAYGTQRKESVLGSITTLSPKDLKIPSSNLTTAFAGRVAGMSSYQRSGEPGADDADFFVRGVTSFSYAGGGPLILIDGLEVTKGDLSRLQPDDIESFSIMKDATAAALYGARGANGVIMVTTKQGKEGPASISVRYENCISNPTSMVQFADPITYMRLNNEAVLTRDPLGIAPYSLEKIDKTIAGANPMVYPATDWKNSLLNDQAINSRLNFNLSGGGKVARYYVAATYNQDNGNLKMDKKNNFNSNIDLKRFSLQTSININVTKTTELITRLRGNFDDYTGPLVTGTELYNKIMRTDPVSFPAYYTPDAKTAYKKHILFGNSDLGNYINPYAEMVKGYKESATSTMLAQFELKQDLSFIAKGLKMRGMLSTTRYSSFNLSRSYAPFYYTVGTYDKTNDSYELKEINPTTGTDYLNYSPGGNNITTKTYMEAALTYDKSINKKHNFSALLVTTARTSMDANPATLQLSLPSKNAGLSGRATYNYDSRYFLEGNFGYNGSERFAAHNRFGFFPSIGGGWIISNEQFWQDYLSSNIDLLKLKATYGLVGNDQIGDADDRFYYMSEVNMNNASTGYVFGEEFGASINGISISRYPNENITWEISKKLNLGLEAKFFNMLNLSVEYYTENRRNVLLDRLLPVSMGLMAATKSNTGEAKSSGWDASVDAFKSFNKNFWIQGRANLTYATTKVTKYEEVDYRDTPWKSRIGQPGSQQWGYIAERLFVDQKEVANSPKQFGNYGAGDIKFRDVDGNGIIDELDMVPLGYPTSPEIVYGFGTSIGYHGFDFSFFLQGTARETFWIDPTKTAPFIDTDGTTSISKNQLLKVYADNHWSENDRNLYALWPRLSSTVNSNNTQKSSWFMRDGSFLRLKSVEIGYTVPSRILKPIFAKSCRIYLSGTNLAVLSKFKLWDPEMAGNGLGYPLQRVVNAGLQVSF
ncbi:MAG: TonB-dependent receptor [Bacteroidia bacterium]|nr:TonB-dependent receptor [Bacteroidia bacterium]